MGAERTYRVGVVGHTGRGDYGHDLDVAAASVPGVRVVAVADPDPTGRARAQERCGAARGYASYAEMLACERLDLVVIATRWVDEREAMLLAAVGAGAHVYCEKPFARTLAEADRVLAAAEAAGRKIAVAHVSRAFSSLGRLRELVATGAIGRLRLLRGHGKCDRRGGGQDLIVLGTHILDLMRYFGGDVAWAQAHVSQDGHDVTPADARPGDEGVGPVAGDAVTAYYAFRSGVAAQFETFVAEDGAGESYFSLTLQGTAGAIGIRSHGDRNLFRHPRGAFVPDAVDRWSVLELPGHETEAPRDAAESQRWAHRRLIADLLAAVEQDRQPRASARDARGALEMIMGAYESQLLGRRVSFPLEHRGHPLARLAGDDGSGGGG